MTADDEVEAFRKWFEDNGEWVPPSQSVRAALSAAAKVRAIREGDGEWVAEIEGLIDAYWGLAFTEGSEGRTTDTPDGAAQDTRAAISRRLRALAASPIPATGGEKE